MADSKTPPKAMDIVHTAGSQPSATGRPVIVSNRSYIKVDPMLNAEGTSPIAGAQPSADARVASSERGAEKGEITVAVPQNESPSDDTSKLDSAPLPSEESGASEEIPEKTTTASTSDEKKYETTETERADDSDQDTTSAPSAVRGTGTSDSEGLTGDIPQSQTGANSDDDTVVAREEEIERLIASRTYALPIDKTGRRRKTIVLWVLVLVLLIIVAVDVLADMGVISLPFGMPHTSFFSD